MGPVGTSWGLQSDPRWGRCGPFRCVFLAVFWALVKPFGDVLEHFVWSSLVFFFFFRTFGELSLVFIFRLLWQFCFASFWLKFPFLAKMKRKRSSSSIEHELSEPLLRVTVALPSGNGASFRMGESSKVGDLKAGAQEFFGKRFLQLATTDGCVLTDPMKSLQAAGLQDGEHLTAIAGQAKLAGNGGAFVLWCLGGHGVVAWGSADCGGDSSEIQDQLMNVQQIQATDEAFAAILEDGSVVT